MLIKNLISYWMMTLLLIVSFLLIISIFFLQEKKVKGFQYLGISLFAVGAANLLICLLTDTLALKINTVLSFGSSFWKQVLLPLHSKGIMLGTTLVIEGIIFYVLYIIIIKISQKKRAK